MNNDPEIINEEDGGAFNDKVKKIKEKLEACQKEKTEYLAGWQRSQADFINYKRRQEEQVGEWLKMAGSGLTADLLSVLDTLDASMENGGDDGLAAIREQLYKILQEHGLREIKSVGEKFNPEFHEAVEITDAESGEKDAIVGEIQKGYLLNGKILRAAKVKVTKN